VPVKSIDYIQKRLVQR